MRTASSVVPVAQDRQDRAEDFLARDGHVRPDAAEHRGTDVVAAVEAGRPARAAGGEPRALADAGLDQALDLVELRLADDRPEIDARRARVADLEAVGDRRGDGERLVVPLGRHEHAGRGVAGLAAVGKARPDAFADRSLEIRIAQNEVRRLAAELLRHPLHSVRRRLGDQNSGPGRAGERDHVDAGMGGQRLADLRPSSVDEIEDSGGRLGRLDDLGEDQAAHRRDLARLQNNC